jgi:hypothetical protein
LCFRIFPDFFYLLSNSRSAERLLCVRGKPRKELLLRFLVMHKSNEENEAGVPPSRELMEEMGKLMEESAREGVLLAAEGVHPSSRGARLSFSGGKRTVTDGPFAEAKELIAGFAVLQVDSKEEAIEWATRFADVIGDVEIEVRQVIEISDLAPENDPYDEGGAR